ncbi:MAG TPA: hypothetical protein PLU49_04915 [Saprospiraceae bacterium]|nr:hypothetical protein [Saprospiraceae bacterium]
MRALINPTSITDRILIQDEENWQNTLILKPLRAEELRKDLLVSASFCGNHISFPGKLTLVIVRGKRP